MKIKIYDESCYNDFLDLVLSDDDFMEYSTTKKEDYKKALEESVVFLAYDESICIGYIRVKKDRSFGVYVYDLLIRKSHRGHKHGKKLLDHVSISFPDQTIYVMSDEDTYYEQLGYEKIGSIFEVNKP